MKMVNRAKKMKNSTISPEEVFLHNEGTICNFAKLSNIAIRQNCNPKVKDDEEPFVADPRKWVWCNFRSLEIQQDWCCKECCTLKESASVRRQWNLARLNTSRTTARLLGICDSMNASWKGKTRRVTFAFPVAFFFAARRKMRRTQRNRRKRPSEQLEANRERL